jgi:hypothetical protein
MTPTHLEGLARILYRAIDNIVGKGAQHETTCDRAEHADGGKCIWCEARDAMQRAERLPP